MTENDDQLTLANYESISLESSPWETWIAQVEKELGHSADGDQTEDFYSLDGFYQLYIEGSTPSEAVKEVGSITFSAKFLVLSP